MQRLKIEIWVTECNFFACLVKAKVNSVLEIDQYIPNTIMLMPFTPEPLGLHLHVGWLLITVKESQHQKEVRDITGKEC